MILGSLMVCGAMTVHVKQYWIRILAISGDVMSVHAKHHWESTTQGSRWRQDEKLRGMKIQLYSMSRLILYVCITVL